MNLQSLHHEFCVYQKVIKNYKPQTVESYGETLRLFLHVCPEVQTIEQISFFNLRRFFYWGREKRHWKALTFRSHYKRLNVFLKWAHRKGYIDENPLEALEQPKVPKRIPKSLNKKQVEKIIEAAGDYSKEYHFIALRN